MKKYLLLLFIIALLAVSGCSDENISNTTLDSNSSNIVKVTDMQQIEDALSKGPVFLDIGFESCPACKVMKPIISEMSNEYINKTTVMYIDTRENPQLAQQFDVYSVPDMCVILDNDSEGFNYVTSSGEITRDRSIARFIGVSKKSDLTSTIDKTLQLKSNLTV